MKDAVPSREDSLYGGGGGSPIERRTGGVFVRSYCPSVCKRLFDGVQALYKGVQDDARESGFCSHPFLFPTLAARLTSDVIADSPRFYILARSIDEELPSAYDPCCPWSNLASLNKGLMPIRETRNYGPPFGLTYSWFSNGMRGGLVSILPALDLPICRLDRRPVLGERRLHMCNIVKMDGDGQSPNSVNSSSTIPSSPTIKDMEAYGRDRVGLQSNRVLVQLESDGLRGGSWKPVMLKSWGVGGRDDWCFVSNRTRARM